MNLCSDNVTGIAREILDALAGANNGPAMPYGNDPITRRLGARVADLFETDVKVFPGATGTAANAVASLGGTPADLSWCASIDALSLGATKNGALVAGAVVFFRPQAAVTFGYLRKRGAHRFSKMRFLSAQLDACRAEDRWPRRAGHANAMARRPASPSCPAPGCCTRWRRTTSSSNWRHR